MITIVSWKWTPAPNYPSQFRAEHVNTHFRMVERHAPFPHEYVCVTDDPEGLDPRIRVVPLWRRLGDITSPHGASKPSCYRRLRAFSREAGRLLGRRILSIDLDAVVTGDLTPLVEREEDFVIWGDTNSTTHYNGGLWLLRAGSRPQVWEQFDPRTSPWKANRAGQHGSDQAWISYCLGPGEAKYGRADGVYSYRVHIRPTRTQRLPAGARIVLFHGKHDPWGREAQKLDWVRNHYR